MFKGSVCHQNIFKGSVCQHNFIKGVCANIIFFKGSVCQQNTFRGSVCQQICLKGLEKKLSTGHFIEQRMPVDISKTEILHWSVGL